MSELVSIIDLTDSPLHQLPLEIIAKIVQYLSLSDVIGLVSVSKIWRSTFINQNVIWKDICRKLSVHDDDYSKCLNDPSSHYSKFNAYFESNSLAYFGPMCYWWKIYNQYNMILKNIKQNDITAIRIPRKNVFQSYCTDGYIINLYWDQEKHKTIETIILGSNSRPVRQESLPPIDFFFELYICPQYRLKIIGNTDFLVFEIHSIIFVYKIIDGEFVIGYSRIIQRPGDEEPDLSNICSFLDYHSNTVIDLSGDKLAFIHPENNIIFLIDLKTGCIFKELVYSTKPCFVDTLKYADKRLMIGISTYSQNNDINQITSYLAVVYHLEEYPNDNQFIVSLFGPVTKFKVTDDHIGIENKAAATPILVKRNNNIRVIWIDCDTFSFDCTRKFLYYSVNSSIYQYDLDKSINDKYEVTQKIAIDAVSTRFSLTPINDRFLLVHSISPNAYDIFDVKSHNTVKSLPLRDKSKLAHVGKLCIMMTNASEVQIYSFF